MSSRESSSSAAHAGESALPSARDLDRLASVLQSVGEERAFPRRVVDRYRQWIFLFIGWCLRVPSGTVSRRRIGDFWGALSEHDGTETAKICEAMDALGFFFGGVLRETDVVPFAEAEGTDEGRGRGPAGADSTSENGFMRPNPSLRAPESGARPSDQTLTDRERSRHLPEGTLPEAVDARAWVPTQGDDRDDPDGMQPSPDAESRSGDATAAEATDRQEPREADRGARDRPTTLFNPEGTTPPPEWASTRPDPGREAAASNDEGADAPSGTGGPDDASGPETETTDRSASDLDRSPSGDAAPTPLRGPGGEHAEEPPDTVPVEIPRPVADRLRRMAQRLGLPPSVCAARAIEMVCEDAGVERSQSPSIEAPLKHYQAQLDLLRLQKDDPEPPVPDLPTGDDVNPGAAP